ncbi:MAG: hypothetical protein US36_C0006G0022 [Candidatus Wolfebacteria bacterium GW2011_GWC1_37_10]|nr:MAG: hypothetical protein US36_C0006G0022 [Candidatus Wolfebacteria bacterium GW2011_GWC1_37_10]
MKKKGFTLLELLIVIGILAILATTVTLVLNPAELLKQARDSQRLGDLRSVHAALGMYAATATVSPLFIATSTCTFATTTGPFSGGCITNSTRSTNGTGWVNVNFSLISGGSPLSVLPIDPSNNANYLYGFKNDVISNTWELDTVLESSKYNPMMGSDGGNQNGFFEIGSYAGLAL